MTKTENSLKFYYNQMQNEIFRDLPETYRYIICAKGRRSGATYGAMQYCFRQALKNSLNILWVDTNQRNLHQLYSSFFQPVLNTFDGKYYKYNKIGHQLTFANSNIYFRSAEKPDSLEGFFYDVAILNEAGLILKKQKGRDLWNHSILPMLIDRGAPAFIIGTPKGLKARKDEDADYSLFYELFQKGQEKGQTQYVSRRYSSYCNIDLLAKQLMIGERNRGKELTFEQARQRIITDINQLSISLPYYVRGQEIYAEFIDREEQEIFHQEWFDDIVDALPDISRQVQTLISLDTAFKIGESNDYSAAICITQTVDGHYYIQDIFNEKHEFPQLITATKAFYNMYPECRCVLIEDKASGIPLIQTLRQEGDIPLKPIQVTKDKLSRAEAVTPLFKSGKVHLLRGDWNTVYIDQMCQFNGLFDSDDDLVDATSQALNYMSGSTRPKAGVVSVPVNRTSNVLRGYNA